MKNVKVGKFLKLALFGVVFGIMAVLATQNNSFCGQNLPYIDTNGLTYGLSTDNTTVTVTGYTGNTDTVTIPATITVNNTTYSVTSIGTGAFYECSSLTTVTFGASSQLQTICNSAFSGCTNLESIIIPAGVTSINDMAFYGCTSLKTIVIPTGVTIINEAVFSGAGLESITIPKGVNKIDGSAFSECSSLTTVTFEEDSQLKTICNNAFNCTSLTEIIIPASVTSIGEEDEDGNIGESAFYGCSWEEEDESGNIIYHGLTTVTFEEDSQLKTIGGYTFSDCTSLKTVTLEKALQLWAINESAFSGCTNLESIIIPASVTRIEVSAFYGCTSLKTVTFAENSQLDVINESVFDECTSLTTVTFEEGSQLQTIGNCGFHNCTSLAKIEIPKKVSIIEVGAFGGCTSLTTVTFEKDSQLKKIGGYAFSGCISLKEIKIPAGVSIIGEKDKEDKNGGYAFNGCSSLTTVTFEKGSQLETIGNCGFHNCISLAKIEIPKKVSIIEVGAFGGCTNLTTVTFEKGSQLQTIGGYAFSGCISLKEIKIPAGVSIIGEKDKEDKNGGYAFNGCELLTTVTFEKGSQLKEIYSAAFATSGIKSAAQLVRVGYTLEFYQDEGLTKTSDGSKIFEPNEDEVVTTYHTKWVEKAYTVKFDLNGGCIGVSTEFLKYGVSSTSQIEFPEGTPTKKECDFQGWNTKADGSGTDVTGDMILEDILTNNTDEKITIYAKWEKKPEEPITPEEPEEPITPEEPEEPITPEEPEEPKKPEEDTPINPEDESMISTSSGGYGGGSDFVMVSFDNEISSGGSSGGSSGSFDGEEMLADKLKEIKTVIGKLEIEEKLANKNETEIKVKSDDEKVLVIVNKSKLEGVTKISGTEIKTKEESGELTISIGNVIESKGEKLFNILLTSDELKKYGNNIKIGFYIEGKLISEPITVTTSKNLKINGLVNNMKLVIEQT